MFISLPLLFSGLINFTNGQVSETSQINTEETGFKYANGTTPENSTTTINNTIFDEKPPITVGDRVASLYSKVSPAILTDKEKDTSFQLRLVDNKTGNNIPNVNYLLNLYKGNKLLLRELFYSKDGPLTLKFEPSQGPLTVHASTEPFLGGWMNETGPIRVSGPVFTEAGQYYYTAEIWGYNHPKNIFIPEHAPRFDSSFIIKTNGTEQSKQKQTNQTKPNSISESNPQGLLILSDNSFTDSVGILHVVGEVQNNAPSTAQFVQVIGTFYDNNNQVVGTQFTYTNPSDIPSGQKAPFDLTLLSASISVSQIDHYRLIASSQ